MRDAGERPRRLMTPAAYLKDRLPAIGLVLGCALAVGAAVATLGAGTDAAVLLFLFVALCGAGGLSWDYLRIRRFYRELGELAAQLNQPRLMPSLLDEPLFLEGRLAFEALDSASKAAADEAARYRNQAESYRDYIELWIHEIKTPIAAACLISASLHGSEANRLKGELDCIEAYVEQALYYARSTSLARDYAIREVDLAACVREACKKNARYLIEQGTTPDIGVADGERVFADEKWLSFVLGQIIVNAAKYGAVRIRFSSRIEGEGTSAARTVLEVADDGCGIPAADVPRVFDRGFTGANGRKKGTSTGMGLYLVAQLCEKMGLGVAIASEEGTGTRVLVSFPHDRRAYDLRK